MAGVTVSRAIAVISRTLQLFILIIIPDHISSAEDHQNSQFPNGPFALPMSKDGCPEGPSRGWKTGYINITTVSPFDKPLPFLQRCRQSVDDLHNYHNSHSNTTLIGPFDRFTLQMNFCSKLDDHPLNDKIVWTPGSYGLFGTDNGCPEGFTSHEMIVCLPPLLHYNVDGHIPHIEVVEELGYAELLFTYCRRVQSSNDTSAQILNSFNPFVVIKDPEAEECPDTQGYDVETENVPLPLPARVMNISNDIANDSAYFQMEFCHFISKDYKIDRQADSTETEGSGVGVDDEDYAVSTKYQTDYWQILTRWFGYPGFGYAFVDVDVLVNQCGDYVIGPILHNCGDVETWVMLDARQTVLVSGIMFTKMHTMYHGQLSQIFVGDDKWSFLHDGAFLCRHTGPLNTWDMSHQVVFRCYRSIFGRYVTLVFRSRSDYWDDVYLDLFSQILISILSYTRDQVTMMKSMSRQTRLQPEIIEIINDIMAVVNNTDFDRPRCNQEIGMRNYDISDQQLTASSWQQMHEPSEARPHFAGWCAENSDASPFIQVDLIFVTYIDGIVITNWFEVADVMENNTYKKVAKAMGSYSFYVEYGTSLLLFDRYNKKHFVYDASRRFGEPQSFLLSDPFPARYIRIFPSPFPNTENSCMKFELLGCRHTNDDDLAPTLRLEADWRLVFDATLTNVTEANVLTSFNYPRSHAYISLHQWTIQLPGKYAVLVFADISLREFEDTAEKKIFLNDNACKDIIIASPYASDIIADLFVILSNNWLPSYILDSSYNGRTPSFFMMGQVAYLAFMTCPKGNLITPGRGFKVYVSETENPYCEGSILGARCTLPTMDMITTSFLGRLDSPSEYQNQHRWSIQVPNDSLVMTLKIEDFDVSCNSESEVELHEMATAPKFKTFCNSMRPHGEMHFIAGPISVLYKQYYVNMFRANVFPEGFRMKYNFLPRQNTIPYRLKIKAPSSDSSVINRQVCVDDVRKCYEFQIINSGSWMDVAQRCKYSKASLVNIKTLKELQLIRGLLLDFYQYLAFEKFMFHTVNTTSSHVFIGLTRYIDSFGILHEFWTDGTPLTYSAWDLNQPADVILNQCTTMHVQEPNNRNSWKTESCHRKVPGFMIYVCEQNIESGDESFTDTDEVHTDAGAHTLPVNHTVFKCGSGEFVSNLALCNGISECSDSSDENSCALQDGGSCKEDEFKCTDGRCIHVSQVCDFREDCLDAVDEYCDFPRCKEEEFTCSNGQCIPSEHRCDAEEHCFDDSDERNCDACIESKAFQCGDKMCIPIRLVCDVHVDCPDGADEKSCDRTYATCEDLWMDGITTSQIYELGAERQYVYCDFDNLKTNNSIKVTYLNSDWKQISNTGYSINTPGIYAALDAGYICMQKFSEVPHRERLQVMKLENQTYPVNEWEYELMSKHMEFQFPWKMKRPINETFKVMQVMVHPAFDRRYQSFSLTTMGDFKHSENRISIGPIECEKELSERSSSMEKTIFCREGVKSVRQSKRCLYDKDTRGLIDGCRSLNHLQNCENFTCPIHHFKCPQSFCIPLMYVCNGQIDCGDGSDERHCACDSTETKTIVIMIPSSNLQSSLPLETAVQLGGMLYTDSSTVKVLRRHNNGDTAYFDGVDIVSNSENFAPVFSIHRLGNSSTDNETDIIDMFGNKNPTGNISIIWLSHDTSTDDMDDVFKMLDTFVQNHTTSVHKYRVTIDTKMKTIISVSHHKNVTNINIRTPKILRTIGSTVFPNLCKGKLVTCNGMYRCRMSKVCIPLVQVCDGRNHCPFSDDEEHCENSCPVGCTCGTATISCRGSNPHVNDIYVQHSTRTLDISNTRHIGRAFIKSDKTNVSLLMLLNVSNSDLVIIDYSSFESIHNLITLDLSYNLLITISRNTFSPLKFLRHLYLHGNRQLQTIEPGAFMGLRISSLIINHAKIRLLAKDTFSGLNLTVLDISNNRIQSIQDFAFAGLYSVAINISNNPIKAFSKELFDGVQGVKQIKTSAYKFCCVRPAYVAESNCLPYKDEFSSCEDLMRKTVLRALLWIVGFLALLGNVMSLVYRIAYDRKRLKLGYGIFVTNLAIADLFMGMYMLIIAVADTIFRNRYIEMDEQWRNSIWCKCAGILSTISSEASVFFICLITIDRLLVIKFPFGQHRFHTRSAVVAAVASWTLASAIAFLPIIHRDYFQDTFYSKSAVCLALPLTRDRPPGWLYSIVIFIGFNLITFVLIAVGQLLIYAEIKKHASIQKSMNVSRTRDLKVARNLLLVVTTDFLCWFPVGMMGILALSGHTISSEVYAWTAVLVLPVNSALNPLMYTASAILGKKRFSPSIEEQSRSESTKEMGKAVLNLYPYIALKKGLYNKRLRSLALLLLEGKLTVTQLTSIIYQVYKFEDLLHGDDLVLKKITEEDILVKDGKAKIIGKKVHILGNPVLCTSKKDVSNDIYLTGRLLERTLLTLGHR